MLLGAGSGSSRPGRSRGSARCTALARHAAPSIQHSAKPRRRGCAAKASPSEEHRHAAVLLEQGLAVHHRDRHFHTVWSCGPDPDSFVVILVEATQDAVGLRAYVCDGRGDGWASARGLWSRMLGQQATCFCHCCADDKSAVPQQARCIPHLLQRAAPRWQVLVNHAVGRSHALVVEPQHVTIKATDDICLWRQCLLW